MKTTKTLLAAMMIAILLCAAVSAAYAGDVYKVNSEASLCAALTDSGFGAGDTLLFTGSITAEALWDSYSIPAGATIDGQNYTLTIKYLNSGSAYSVFNGTNYTIQNLTISCVDAYNAYGNGIVLSGSDAVASNITFTGKLSNGICVAENGPTVKNCTFGSSLTWGIYTSASTQVGTVEGCTFDSQRAVALYGNETFTGNTVNSDKGLSVATTGAAIEGNTFTGDRALSLSADDIVISNNSILNGSAVEIADGLEADLSDNYWGSAGFDPAQIRPQGNQTGKVTVNTYYETLEDMLGIAKAPEYSAPRTGDDSQILLWAAFMLISALGAVTIARKSAMR